MKKRHRNELFHLISKVGLTQNDFEISEGFVHDLHSTFIRFRNTPFVFIIRNSKESFDFFDYQFTPYGPGNILTEIKPANGFIGFSEIHQEFEKWLVGDIKGYIEDDSEPDLWSEYKNGNTSLDINSIDFSDQSAFSLDEKKHVSMAINELKLLIHKNINTTVEEQKLVIERLDYLIDASNRLNKFDWKSLAVSTLFSITIALSLDTQKGQLLFDLFKKVFSVMQLLSPSQ